MAGNDDFLRFMAETKYLSAENRQLRLRLGRTKCINDDMFLPQQVSGSEAVCGGIEYRVLCVCTKAGLPLKELIGCPAAIEFVTDRNKLRRVCGFVTEVSEGDSDGGLATYQLVVRDGLSIMEKRSNTRVFRNKNEFEIVLQIVREWLRENPVLGGSFDIENAIRTDLKEYPPREFTFQVNESDAAFIRRLLKRRGIAWYFRTGRARDCLPDQRYPELPIHTLVLFNYPDCVRPNAAGTIAFQREHGSAQRDVITSWHATRCLQTGSVTRHSADYRNPMASHFGVGTLKSEAKQGSTGTTLARSLDDYLVQPPHYGDTYNDSQQLIKLRMQGHEYAAKYFHGEGTVRDLCAGEYFTLRGHPEIDTHPPAERDFVVTAMRVAAVNNLPGALAARVARLFATNGWPQGTTAASGESARHETGAMLGAGPTRFLVQFTAVRRDITIVPAYDERTDMPHPPVQSALVVGAPNDDVTCDVMGRVYIHLLGARPGDDKPAGADGKAWAYSALVRVAAGWAGCGPGSALQCGTANLPRNGAEVLVDFVGGDPDKPIIVGQLFNALSRPPALSQRGELPGNRYLSGIKSRENRGTRGNQLCFDDTYKQISAQLSSDHGVSQLNLGDITAPRSDGVGKPRGEGAELRSDLAVAVRGAEGVLITADPLPDVDGMLLERSAVSALVDTLHKLAGQLSRLAVTHAADPVLGPELGQLIGKLKQLDEGRSPIVAVSAPAGLVLASGQHALLGASGDVNLVSGAAAGLVAAADMALRSGAAMSLFAHKDGIKLTAVDGTVQLQAQHDAMQLLAQKVLDIISTTDWINIQAKQGVRIHGGGSELVISAAGIVLNTDGNYESHAAEHQTLGPKGANAKFPGFSICTPSATGAAQSGALTVPSN